MAGSSIGGRATKPHSATQPEELLAGAATGVGSLPHRSTDAAARFALHHYDVPAIPTLPRGNPAESMIAQAVLGIDGVTAGQYGGVAIDVARLDPEAPVTTNLNGAEYATLRRFLDVAVELRWTGPVKWQFVGPVTLGVALTRAGLDVATAFAVATKAVHAHLEAIHAAVMAVLPQSPQIAVLDEPMFSGLLGDGFPIAPEPAIDLLSTAMATLSDRVPVGVHCCGELDVASLVAAGSDLLSFPVSSHLLDSAGYLGRFLDDGGIIAWGVVATDGPVSFSPERAWRTLSTLWHGLSDRGVDPGLLRSRSMVTPQCGLATHTPQVAAAVCNAVRAVGRRIRA